MAIELKLNPTIVNVVTDASLILVAIIWYRALMWWTVSDVKRQLRKRSKIYSFEILGGLQHMYYGLMRAKTVRKSEDDIKLRKSWYRLTMRAVILFVLSISVVALHMLIDFGLDFQTETLQSVKSAEYKMLEFVPTGEFEAIRKEFLPARDDRSNYTKAYCASVGREDAPAVCDAHVLNFICYCHERVREAFIIARNLLESSSLEQLDMVNKILFSYGIYENSQSAETLEADCRLKEERNMQTFGGDIALDGGSSCEHGELNAWLLNIGTRVEQVPEAYRIHAPSALVERVSSDTQMLTMFGYRNMKDQRQFATVYNVTREDTRGQQGEKKFARVDADARIRYVEDTDQQVVLLDLEQARIANGKQPHVTHTLGEFRLEREMRINVPDFCQDFIAEAMFVEEIDVLGPDGNQCNTAKYGVQFGGLVCVQYPREINGKRAHIALQSLQTLIFFTREEGKDSIFDTEDECLRQGKEAFSEELENLEDDYEFAMTMALDVQIVCATMEGELTKKCIGGPGRYRFNGEEWIDVSDDPSAEDTWGTTSVSHWSAVQLVNVERDAARECFANLTPLIQWTFRFPYAKVETNIMRMAIVGIRIHWALQLVFAALGTQLRTTTRELFTLETTQNTLLRLEYLIGWGVVLIITLATLIVALFYHMHERRAYAKLGITAQVPLTKTEWIAACLPYLDESDPDATIFRHEFTSKVVENDPEAEAMDDLTANGEKTSRAKLGFFSEPVPLNSQTHYELSREGSL